MREIARRAWCGVFLAGYLWFVGLSTAQAHKTEKKAATSKQVEEKKAPTPKQVEEEVIVVTGTRSERRVSDTPVKTEVIREAQIEAKGARNLLEALAFEAGVRLDNQCSVCNTTGLRLSGLPSRYLLVMIDGMPVFSSLGMTYGLLQIDTMDIKQIELVKGANSVLYGTDAISGVVNIITKLPKRGGEGSGFVEVGSFGSLRLGGSVSYRKDAFSMVLTGSFTRHDRVDRDDDGVSEYTGFDRFNASMRLRYAFSARTSLIVEASFLQENRQGGAAKGSFLEVLSDFNRDADPEKGERVGARGLSETILTRRISGALRFQHILNEWVKIQTILTALSHHQDSDYEGLVYVGDQVMFFAQQSIEWNLANRLLLHGGLSYRYEGLTENLALSAYQYHQPGAYLQAEWLATPWFELVGGFRYDWHNIFGHIPTPRVAFKLAPTRWLTFRGVWGMGFRASTTFYEYAHGARPQGYQLLNEAQRPERSQSVNASVSITSGAWLNLTIEGAWNRITDPITWEVTGSEQGSQRQGDIRVFNSDGQLDVFSLEIQAQSNPLSWLRLSGSYGFYEYINKEVLVSAAPRHHFTMSVDARIPRAETRISLTGEMFLPIDLDEVYGQGFHIQGKPSLERWLNPANADLTRPKLSQSPLYGVVNLRIEQPLSPILRAFKIKPAADLALYFGIDNLLDYHQSDIDGPIFFPNVNGQAGAANIVRVWGPLRGRFFYAGLRIKGF